MPTLAELGKRLKRARTERDLTLKEVEHKSGVSATHISQIERGKTSPTVGALQKLARALEIETSFFLEEVELPEVAVVDRERPPVVLHREPLMAVQSLTTGIPGSHLHFFLLKAEPGGDGPVISHSHEGEECGTVIKGTMIVTVGSEEYVLRKGESIHFRAKLQHGYRAAGREEAESVWASTSVGFL